MRADATATSPRLAPVHDTESVALRRSTKRGPALRSIALVGTYPPRRCGIATFTADLTRAIVAALPETKCRVVAVTEPGGRRTYPERVRTEIIATDVTSYRRAARDLNRAGVDVVGLQHEFGIFGGPQGSHVLELLHALEMPVVSTLHTVLANPDAAHRAVLQEVVRSSERAVVMSTRGVELLAEVYGVPRSKIDYVPHGIRPVTPDPRSKARLGLHGRAVLLTFGLVSPNKGIEHVVEALPEIVARHPNTTYVVVGATHPEVRRHEGEKYRVALMDRAKELGVDGHTMFVNRFVSETELDEFLSAADVYVTPYSNTEQITSGTLSHAAGAGKAIVSTPYVHARELLADGRGVLVPCQDPPSLARAVIELFDDGESRAALGDRARDHTRTMLWPVVARRYTRRLERSVRTLARRRRSLVPSIAGGEISWPRTNLAHLGVMTDAVGLHQHALLTVPDPTHGYCLDDNARALLLSVMLEADDDQRPVLDELGLRYAAFVEGAYDPASGRFRNFMNSSRAWTEPIGSEDSHGRALWALGAVVARRSEPAAAERAAALFRRGLRATLSFTSPRAWAYALLGIGEYVRACRGNGTVGRTRELLARRLLELLERCETTEWPWFEPEATYCNARLPQALILSGRWMHEPAMSSAGLRSLEWLCRIQSDREGRFAPIGSNGFYPRGGSKAAYDQQPVEACAMVSACLEAARATRDARWHEEAARAFRWFLGHNALGEPLYDATTGGCRDGLHVGRPNLNQGAEATLSFHLALVEMRRARASGKLREAHA